VEYNKLFEEVLKESLEIQKAYSDGNEISRRVAESIKAIELTKDPLLTLVKWRIPISIILEAISEYCHSIILRESKTKMTRTPNLPDIDNAINYYNKKLGDYSSNFNPELTKFSDLSTLDINRKGILERLNYGILAARNCKDKDERKNLMGVISDLIKPTNIYINDLNRVIDVENERRQEKNISPLKEIEPISINELKTR